MPASRSSAVLRSEDDTACAKSAARRPSASMKKATVDPLPTPTTRPGVRNRSAASAAARFRSDDDGIVAPGSGCDQQSRIGARLAPPGIEVGGGERPREEIALNQLAP